MMRFSIGRREFIDAEGGVGVCFGVSMGRLALEEESCISWSTTRHCVGQSDDMRRKSLFHFNFSSLHCCFDSVEHVEKTVGPC
jgi:hypothetical protein